MKIIIFGCGRVGSRLAVLLHSLGHDVSVIDYNPDAFLKLPETYKGTNILGNGMDDDVLRRAGIEKADALIAVTQGDNRNIMVSEIAKYIYNVPKVITRVYDPVRCEMFGKLGLDTSSPTLTFTNAISEDLLQGWAVPEPSDPKEEEPEKAEDPKEEVAQ
jgi:trk system potassium uptake protein TrkA